MFDAEGVLDAALGGDRSAMRTLVERLAPVIFSRVTRMAQRSGRRTHDQARQLGEDLKQEVFAALFQDRGRALREWVPTRGLSLESYVGILAEHQAASILRSGRRSAWREHATEDEALTRAVGSTDPGERRINARDMLLRVVERIREELSPRGLQIFELLIVEERPIEEVSHIMEMRVDALYAWRSRIGKLANRIAAELDPVSERAIVSRVSTTEAR